MQGEGVEPPRPLATGLQPASVANPTLHCGLTGTRTRFCRLRTCGPTHGRSSRGALAETRTPLFGVRCGTCAPAPLLPPPYGSFVAGHLPQTSPACGVRGGRRPAAQTGFDPAAF